MFLIHGCFFQNQEWLGVQMVPIEGMVAVIEQGLLYATYAGVIGQDGSRSKRLVGGMADHYGESVLSDIRLDETEVSFTKKYVRRKDEIRYTFKVKDRNTWAGEYSGSAVGRGLSRCVITEVEDDFLEPGKLMGLLGYSVAHSWNEH